MWMIINNKAYHVKIIVGKSPQGMGAATRSSATNNDEDEDEIKRVY